jgi:hypothetical protein
MPTGYDPSAFPTSYKDPAYDQADQAAAASVGIPLALLSSIRTKGEKSNADQVSSAGAATPYQITPKTRQSIIDQTGVDPWLNPQTAAYGAAYLLKQNLDRNGGNPVLAVTNYVGGTDPKEWGPQTMAYAKRVTGFTPKSYVQGQSPNPFALQSAPDVGSAPGSIGPQSSAPATGGDPYALQPAPNVGQAPGAVQSGPSPLEQAYQAYKNGSMSPEDAAQFEQDVNAGRIVLPAGSTVKPPAPQAAQPKIMPIVPQAAIDAFNKGQMSPEDAAQFQKDLDAGNIALPPNTTLNPPAPGVGRAAGVAERGFLEGLGQGVGSLIDKAKNIVDLPVNAVNAIAGGATPLNAVDALFGTHLASPPNAAAAPLAGAPNAAAQLPQMEQVAQAAADKMGLPVAQTQGEQIVQAGARGAGLMVQPFPGMTLAHLPAAVAAGAAGGAVGEQVHQQTGSQALGLAANLLTTALSPIAAARVMKALVGEVGARGAQAGEAGASAAAEQSQAARGEAAAPEGQAQAAETAAAEQVPAATSAESAGTQAEAAAQTAAEEASINPAASPLASAAKDFITPDELAAQTRKATGQAPFGMGQSNAREILASQASPDAETLAAAKRLGIEDNLQPDHLTTNQAYRELAQAIKSTPGSLARQQEMEGLDQIGQRGVKVIEDAGGTRDLSDLSSQVKSQLMTTQQKLDQKAEALYADIKQSVPAKTAAPAQNVLSFIQQRADDLGGAKNLSAPEKMILGKLSPKEIPMTVGGQEIDPRALGMQPEMQQPSYALLDDVRRNIGNGLRNQGPFKDADTGLLKALYGRISEDQRAALSSVPGALEKFDAARAAVQMRKSVEDDMTSLFGKQLGDSIVGKLGTAISALPKGDESKFVALIKSVPPSMRQQVTASGLGYAFGKATKNGELNFKAYADWMDGLKKNSAAFNAVMGNLPPETRQQLLDLAKVSRGIANATREAITTGRIMAAREELNAHADGVMSNVMNIARQSALGHIGTGAASAGAAIAGPIGAAVGSGIGRAIASALSRGKPDVMKAADELIVSPEFQAIAKSGQPSEAAIKAAANSPKFRRFYDLARAAKTAANDPIAREQWLRGLVSVAGQQALENKR